MGEIKTNRKRRILLWAAAVMVGIPLLFWLFELLNTYVFPENF